MKRKRIFGIVFCLLGIVFSACEKFLTEEPEGQVTYSNFWKTEQDVESAVYGMYGSLRYAFIGGEAWGRDRGLPFDEFSSYDTDIMN